MMTQSAAIYARVSKNRHRCNNCDRTFGLSIGEDVCPHCGSRDIERGQDPTTQLLPLREYAKRRGVSVSEEYVDIGVSGSKERRPQLDRLMKDARLRKFDAVIVASFDRFARSTKHLVMALEEFRSLGPEFVSRLCWFCARTPDQIR